LTITRTILCNVCGATAEFSVLRDWYQLQFGHIGKPEPLYKHACSVVCARALLSEMRKELEVKHDA
jgi:hypothetical protein